MLQFGSGQRGNVTILEARNAVLHRKRARKHTLQNQTLDFVWTDLSSYDLDGARRFYGAIFGWQFQDMSKMAPVDLQDPYGMDQVTYLVGYQGEQARAGLFDMPPFFSKISMPAFWMSYVQVDDVAAVVTRAKRVKGVMVDVEPTPFGQGTMALIRDPSGAGFTCYQGSDLRAKGSGNVYGQLTWNALITSKIRLVAPFYEDALGLRVVATATGSADLVNADGKAIASLHELPDKTRGEKVYWLPFFAVDTLTAFGNRVEKAGGAHLASFDALSATPSALFSDPEGAVFAVSATGASYGSDRFGGWLNWF